MKTSVRSYTDEELLDRVKTVHGYDNIPEGHWILGVRSNEDVFDTYDDKFYEFVGTQFMRVLSGTTNPGGKQLKGGFKKFNRYGSAILKADEWYYDMWEYGMHRGKMPSLRQRGAKVIVYRDGDMDNQAEELGKPISGWFGINYHTNTYDFSKASRGIVKRLIGNWSAGCQVINDRDKYFQQMDMFRYLKQSGEQSFVSYCLLNEF
mgnify:CR=1 FL=1